MFQLLLFTFVDNGNGGDYERQKTRRSRSGLFPLQNNVIEAPPQVLYVTKERVWMVKCNAVSLKNCI
jgi:hypothetical protein